ncbi:hypothetical protein D516_1943 [Rhodobacter sp. AKP1]|nr:hypothetical protein D516_1943 [Rhodobacter sp. AKP1]
MRDEPRRSSSPILPAADPAGQAASACPTGSSQSVAPIFHGTNSLSP